MRVGHVSCNGAIMWMVYIYKAADACVLASALLETPGMCTLMDSTRQKKLLAPL